MEAQVTDPMRYVGIGLYTVPDVARFIGEQTVNVRRWAKGYTWRSRGKIGASNPLFEVEYPELRERGILTFIDMVELHLISTFRKIGVSMPAIRQAAAAIAMHTGEKHPFAIQKVHTDGRRIFTESVMREYGAGPAIIHELPHFQQAMDFAKNFFVKLEYDGDMVKHYWPLGREKSVVLDPARSFGEPIVHPGSVPTKVLHGMFIAGESPERIAWWYDIGVEEVNDAIDFEMSLAA